MSRVSAATALVLLLLTAVSFFHFPGHTWLQSDTQIYVAILEHLWDPSILAKDIVATRPHVSYTIYDEVALALRRVTGLGFREVLAGQQFLFRFLALWGIFLIARALGFSAGPSLLVAACVALGAVINGPAVLLFEYEPVPRAFAVALIFLSLGLAAHRDWLWAGASAGLAFLYHPPTSLPLWLVAGLIWLVLHRRREPLRILIPAAASVVVLVLLARWQAGEREAQDFFGRIDPQLEMLQRMRGPYNWIGQWPAGWFWQYPLLALVVWVAWRKLRPSMAAPLEWLSLGVPLCGLAGVAATWLLLDVGKWSLIPQLQPARAVLFITAFAMILGACAGIRAAEARRGWEALAWFALVYAIPTGGRVLLLLDVTEPLARTQLAVVLALAGLTAGAVWAGRTASWRLAVAAAAPFILIPTAAQVTNYPQLHTAAIAELSGWAGASTPREAVFVFAGFGRDLAPGIFRANARRALFVDWKGGGQVNLLHALGLEWWRRWQALRQGAYQLGDEARFRDLGIDYFVVPAAGAQPLGYKPVFRNATYVAYPAAR